MRFASPALAHTLYPCVDSPALQSVTLAPGADRVPERVPVCVLLLQDLLQSCARGGRRRVEDMCYERRRAEACVDESAHHALVEARRGGTREEPGTLIQGAPVFPGSSRLGIEPKTPGWLVQDPTTSPSGDLIPTIRGSGAHPGRGWDP
jgi:hypothetical protein